MNKTSFPRYISYFFILSNIIITGFLIVIGNTIVSPLLAAIIIAILLKPFCSQLENLGIPRLLSSLLLVILFFLGIFILIIFFTAQIANITSDTSFSYASFEKLIASFQTLLTNWFSISLQEQITMVNTFLKNFVNSALSYFPGALAGTANLLSMMLLFVFSLFIFLYYRSFFLLFIYRLFDEKNIDKVKTTISKIENAVKNYIVGLFLVVLIMATLNSIGLLFIGIRHAIFFGIFGAMLTIIPYIGILIGSLIPAIFALITTDSLWYPAGVILVFSFVQFIEGNFVTPIIVGNKVNINPFFAILGLFIGGMLLGTIGVILAIPLLGIIKIICDQFDYLQPFGYLLGNSREKSPLITHILGYIEKLKNLRKK